MDKQELAILFADIGGSTQLYQRVGDIKAHSMIRESLDSMREAVESSSGILLRTVGDAVLASFRNCDDACGAARSMHEAFYNHLLSVRVGFHWGEAIPDQGDVYGNAVNIAARVSSLANTNEIIVTEEVIGRLAAVHKQSSQLLDRLTVKGVEDPVSIYRIKWESEEVGTATMISPVLLRSAGADNKTSMRFVCGTQTFTLHGEGEECTLGRDDNNQIQTLHASASRIHAKIVRKQGTFVLTDSSTNGTYVDKGSNSPIFVHRESVTLDGAGVIAIGFNPVAGDADSAGLVSFNTYA